MIILISAERSNLSSEVNQHNTESMRNILSSLGLYFESVKGMYKGTEEHSFMIFGIGYKMLERLVNLGAMYNQESILSIDLDRQARLVYLATDEVVHLGTFSEVSSTEGLDAYTITDDNRIYTVR